MQHFCLEMCMYNVIICLSFIDILAIHWQPYYFLQPHKRIKGWSEVILSLAVKSLCWSTTQWGKHSLVDVSVRTSKTKMSKMRVWKSDGFDFTGLSVSHRQNKQMCFQNKHFTQNFISCHHKRLFEICLTLSFLWQEQWSLHMGVCPYKWQALPS